jgi:hypothetical protein
MAEPSTPPGPTPPRTRNLERMRKILARNPAAAALAERLWNFYGCRLMCGTPKDEPRSRINYGIPKMYAPEHRAQDLVPVVKLAKSDRMEEALVHELLHLELVRNGYPRFFSDGTGNGDLWLGITNNADHAVMRPLFTALGYSLDRFTTPSELDDEESRVIAEIDALPNLHTPEGYTVSVSACLEKYGFGFRLVHVRA